MSRLLADCERLFNTSNLYDLLAVPKSASSSQVKKAYYRLSLTLHPDRVAKNEVKGATEKFQVLGKLYSILSDEEKRRIYDDTGSVDDEEFVSVDRDWSDYWRILFPKVSQRDIEDFEAQYKGSEEEVEDLRRAYVSCHGDMDQILESVLCASVEEDEQRFRDILEPLVTSGDLPTFDLFINEPAAKRLARKRKAERERKEAEGEMKKMSKKKKKEEECVGGDDDSLAQLIQARQQSREQQSQDFFAQLEQKYGGAKETKKSNKSSKSSTDKTVSGGKKKKKSKNDR